MSRTLPASDEPRPEVLVVDDRPENVLAMRKTLEPLDVEVFVVGSGNEALALMLHHDFAVALLDVQMPEMDGFELAGLMRSHETTENIPIIFVTAISKEERYAFQGYGAGAVDYLVKPIDPDIVRSKVRVFCELYLQRRRTEQANARLGGINARLHKIVKAVRAFTACRELEHFGPLLLNESRALMPASGGGLYLREENSLRLLHAVNAAAMPERVSADQIGRSCLAQALHEGAALVVSGGVFGMINGPDILELPTLILPLANPGEPFEGVLILHRGTGQPFTEEDKEIGTILASCCWETLRAIRAADILRSNERRFKALFEQAGDYILLLEYAEDGDLIINDANQAACMFHGYTRPELVGKSIRLIDREIGMDQIQMLRSRVLSGETLLFETTHTRKDGSCFPIEVSARSIDIGGAPPLIISVERDITPRKQADEALRSSEERYRKLFERSNDAIFIVDAHSGNCLVANQAAERLSGRIQSNLAQLKMEDILSGPEEGMLKTAGASDGPRDFGEVAFVRPGGTTSIALLETVLLDESSILVIAHDITERKKLEEQYYQAQKMEAVGQLAGGVAHDFNNLLQAIQGYCEMTLLEPIDGPARGYLNEIMRTSERATTLVRQLLAFSRRQVLELEDLDPAEVIGDIAKMIQRLIGEHIAFRTYAEPGLKAIHGDRGQIEQILLNLCINARDAMTDGGTLTIEMRNVVFSPSEDHDWTWVRPGAYVMISVGDTGCGMDSETQQHVFEPFFTTKEQGTGLGLATVFGIVSQHDGLVHVNSRPQNGSTFEVYLPMVEKTKSTAKASQTASVSGGTETILLVDDEECVRGAAQHILQGAGYTVLTACDGEEAIRIFSQQPYDIALVLLDVVMPKLGGKAVHDCIKKIRSDMRVLFSSGYSAESLHTDYVLEDGVFLIQKPYKRVDLLRRIRQMIDT